MARKEGMMLAVAAEGGSVIHSLHPQPERLSKGGNKNTAIVCEVLASPVACGVWCAGEGKYERHNKCGGAARDHLSAWRTSAWLLSSLLAALVTKK